MGLFEDLNAKIDDVQTQLTSAIDTLKSGVGGDPSLNVTADQKTQLLTKLDDFTVAMKSAITAATTPAGPTPTTPPTGTTGTIDVTGTVPPAPAPNPNPTPGP